MKTSSIISEIIQLLITGVVCWLAFTVPLNRFETILLSGLIIVLANIVNVRMMTPLLVSSHTTIILTFLQRVHPDDSELSKMVTDQSEQAKKTLYSGYVSSAYYLVLTFIGLWKLIGALFHV